MLKQRAVENFLRERIARAIAPRTRFAVGTVEDETSCLIKDGEGWTVGYGERGKLWPEARFDSATSAANYLIFTILKEPGGFTFPAVDWTGYASLSD